MTCAVLASGSPEKNADEHREHLMDVITRMSGGIAEVCCHSWCLSGSDADVCGESTSSIASFLVGKASDSSDEALTSTRIRSYAWICVRAALLAKVQCLNVPNYNLKKLIK